MNWETWLLLYGTMWFLSAISFARMFGPECEHCGRNLGKPHHERCKTRGEYVREEESEPSFDNVSAACGLALLWPFAAPCALVYRLSTTRSQRQTFQQRKLNREIKATEKELGWR